MGDSGPARELQNGRVPPGPEVAEVEKLMENISRVNENTIPSATHDKHDDAEEDMADLMIWQCVDCFYLCLLCLYIHMHDKNVLMCVWGLKVTVLSHKA